MPVDDATIALAFFALVADHIFPSLGTAAVISPVNKVGFKGEDIHIPTGEDGMGPLSRPIWKHLTGIQRGAIPSLWSVEVA